MVGTWKTQEGTTTLVNCRVCWAQTATVTREAAPVDKMEQVLLYAHVNLAVARRQSRSTE